MATYTVVRGDTLGKLAAQWDTTVEAIMKANPIITNRDLIRTGWELTIPGSSTDTGEPTTVDPETGLPPTGISEEQNELIEGVMGGDPEIWFDSDADKWYLVYFVPETDVPLLYEADKQAMDALFPDDEWTADKIVATSDIERRGGLYAGTAEDPYGDPYATFIEMLEVEAQIRPWLKDPDMLAIEFEAALEGRVPTSGELMTTEWWRTHNEDERQWLITFHADPKTAEALITDARLQTSNALEAAGVADAPESMVNFMAQQFISGAWSESEWSNQLRAVSDPYSGVSMDTELAKVIADSGQAIDTTHRYENEVRQLVLEWLGPVHGAWSDKQIARWAGTYRNDPDGEEQLISHLRGQRSAIWSEYDNENLTYEDIAGSWRTLWRQTWGSDPNETDPLFDRLMRSESYMDGIGLMRTEGVRTGNEQVLTDLEQQVASTGRRVRRTF